MHLHFLRELIVQGSPTVQHPGTVLGCLIQNHQCRIFFPPLKSVQQILNMSRYSFNPSCLPPPLSLSPFKFRVLPTHDASKVRASGPGLITGVPASFPVEFTIDAKDAGQGQLTVQITVSKEKTRTWQLVRQLLGYRQTGRQADSY